MNTRLILFFMLWVLLLSTGSPAQPAQANSSRGAAQTGDMPLASAATYPLQIATAWVEPEPRVGQVVNLSVAIVSSQDEQFVDLDINIAQDNPIQPGPGASALSWNGSLRANQPYTPTEGPDLPGTPLPAIPPAGICP